jgi:DNA-binding IclR family transcriptional regulator
MVELARKTMTNIGLGVQEDLSVFYLEYALGESNPNRLQRAGFRVPVARTAMGRACIAGMRPEQRERLYEHMRAYYKGEWPALRRELDDAVSQVQIDGYCIAAGTFNATTNTVAVPFVHGDGHTVMAFNSQGHAQRQTMAVMKRNGKRLLDLAREVRRRLADAPHGPSLGHR